jgi:hypothetical protein
MMVEGNETPGSDPGAPGAGRSEGDLFAERRARRAAETGERALFQRAETAEATVRTLEAHVASLQERLREATDERQRISQVERESRAEVEQLRRRLSAGESDVSAVAERLDGVRRELAEAEEAAAAERTEMRRAERALQVRLTELERRAFEIQRGLDAERAARERAEQMLESMQRGQRTLEGLIAELKQVVAKLKQIATARPLPEPPPPATSVEPLPVGRVSAEPPSVPPAEPPPASSAGPAPEPELDEPGAPAGGVQSQADRAEMAEALSAAVGRLRARVHEDPAGAGPDAAVEPSQERVERTERSTEPPDEPVEHGQKPVEPLPRSPESTAARAPVADRPTHKHSMSLIGRWRMALRRRRERRRER